MSISFCDGRTNKQGRELLSHGTALFPVAFYHDNLAEEDVPWHWHDEMELILVSEGESVVMSGSEKYLIKKGNGIFINSGILHAAWKQGEGGCRFHSTVFHPRLVGAGADSVYWQKYLQPLLEDGSFGSFYLDETISWHKDILDSLERGWQSGVLESPGYEFEVRDALSRIIFLLNTHRTATGNTLSEKFLRDEERMKVMLQYIQAHCGEEMNVNQIADSASVSVSECLRCFHSTIGVTPIQYVLQYRIQLASGLLISTSQKIADIGVQCGFQDMSYFARIFKKMKGCTPSEYRKKNNSGQAVTEMLQ